MARSVTEVSAAGRWIQVPSLTIDEKVIVLNGRWLKTASIRSEAWLDTELENPGICIERLRAERRHGFRADIFTFAQKIPGTSPKYDYYSERESIAAVGITTQKVWWEALPQETRKNVRRAEKRGVRVAIMPFDDDLVREIAAINDSAEKIQGVRNRHFRKSFDQVKKDHSSFVGRSDFICAYYAEEMIGFLKLVHKGEVSSILNVASKANHYDKRPSNLLIAKAVEICESRGVSYLTYGLFNYGNKQDSTLRQFKIRNGFEEMFVPRFYIPLTRLGSIAMNLKVHRGLLGILPPRFINFALDVRRRLRALGARGNPSDSSPATNT